MQMGRKSKRISEEEMGKRQPYGFGLGRTPLIWGYNLVWKGLISRLGFSNLSFVQFVHITWTLGRKTSSGQLWLWTWKTGLGQLRCWTVEDEEAGAAELAEEEVCFWAWQEGTLWLRTWEVRPQNALHPPYPYGGCTFRCKDHVQQRIWVLIQHMVSIHNLTCNVQ